MRALILVGCLVGARLPAQTEFYNTDGGRPLRVEDATPTARYALDLHFPTARVERLDGGIARLRVEPALSYGILPRTAVELRAAFVYREAESSPRAGMSGAGIGVMHALTTETSQIPAIALAGELYEPMGSAKTGGAAYSLRTLVSRSWTLIRVHANATYGNYNVTVPQQTVTVCGDDGTFPVPGLRCAGGGGVPPFIPDGPCAVSPANEQAMVAARCSAGEHSTRASQVTRQATTSTNLRGAHWLVGLGADRAFALASVLVMADVFGERYDGLFDRWDWTADVGVRHQFTPTLTVDASAGRRFAGVTHAWIFAAGLTRTTPFGPRGAHAKR